MERIYSDLTVVGAGVAGICASLAAARHGLKVALINDRPVLGGNASSEICVSINGAAYDGYSPSVYAKEGGLVEEVKLTILHYNSMYRSTAMVPMVDAAFFDLIYGEANISLYLNTLIHDVYVENGKVKAVQGTQLGSEKQFRFESPLFVDSSGDGIVGYKAGALYMWGREGKKQFDESLAPDAEDVYVLGDTILFRSRDMGRSIKYKKPKFAYDITRMDFFKNINRKGMHRDIRRNGKEIHGYWWLEFGGQMNTIADNEAITLELRKLVYGLWDYIKNSGDFEDVDTLALDFVAPIPGKRESRRFIGDYVLTQNDIAEKRDYDDAVAVGGWPMDVHAPKGIYDEGSATEWYYVPGMYNIPFRCLYSKNVSNLMFAGRNISATHIAFGSTRVMATGGCMGQAVGTAAYLCHKYGATPAQLVTHHMEEFLDDLQRNDQTVSGRKEKRNGELLKDLHIAASSVKEFCNDKPHGVLELKKELCLAVPIATERFESFEIKVKNNSGSEQVFRLEVYGGERKENYVPVYKIKEIELKVPSNFDDWLVVPVGCSKSGDGKIYMILKKNENLAVYYNYNKLNGVVSFNYYSDDLICADTELNKLQRIDENICFKGVEPEQCMYRVENVLNEYSRPYGLPNIWISGASVTGESQWIEMTCDTPKPVDEIQMVFNSMLEEDNPEGIIPELVKDYDIELIGNTGEKRIIEITDNCLRFRRHKVEATDVVKIKFNFKANYRAQCYEVFSIKLF